MYTSAFLLIDEGTYTRNVHGKVIPLHVPIHILLMIMP